MRLMLIAPYRRLTRLDTAGPLGAGYVSFMDGVITKLTAEQVAALWQMTHSRRFCGAYAGEGSWQIDEPLWDYVQEIWKLDPERTPPPCTRCGGCGVVGNDDYNLRECPACC